ncbi:HIT family protein [Undibacterium terreum]|uniref:HIT family protein n=1 Tax=Undibacterium terreum TaxID=1224302 RepID=A0A916XLG0_9BURK|nr:HIT family protein [Undibacterium terreum]GGC81232.1 HIT family protein [Undibacterium terreum]
MDNCELCNPRLGDVVYSSPNWRVILVDDKNYPGFCRVIWNAHVKEMTDLPAAERNEVMDAVWKLETAIRKVMQPHKINLASFGNMVPHLHWHVIPRYQDDAHFPNPVWAAAHPEVPDTSTRQALLPALRAEIIRQLQA